MKNTFRFFIVATLLVILGACSSPQFQSYEEKSFAGGATFDGFVATTNSVSNYSDAAYDESGGYAQESLSDNQYTEESLPNIQQKLIYTVNMTMETTNYPQAISSIESMIIGVGGYVERSQIYNRNHAEYTARIPAANLDSFLSNCGDVGNIVREEKQTSNVTEQYIDMTARIDTLKIEENTLKALLAQSTKIEDVIQLEQRLSNVRYDIESMESKIRNIDSLVSYSTVNIYVEEVEKETTQHELPKTFWEKVCQSISISWESFVSAMSDIGVFALGKLPIVLLSILIVLVIPIVLFSLIVRAIFKRKRK